MKPEDARRHIAFLLEADALSDIPRAGYVVRKAFPSESVAAHTAGVALLTALCCDARPGLDKARALHMALIHDITEARTMDVPSPYRLHPTEGDLVVRLEHEIVKDLLGHLPAWHDLWRELHDGQSAEARLVRGCDRLQLLVRVLAYQQAGHRNLADFWPSDAEAADLFSEPPLMTLYEALRALRP